MDDKTFETLRLLQRANICDGVLYEPRGFFDLFETYSNDISPGNSNGKVFVNGEDYPLRITHLVSALAVNDTFDPRDIQQYGLRIRSHDQYYMTPVFTPMPLWHNERSAASDVATYSSSSWKFWKPFYMGARDTIQASFQMVVAVDVNDGFRRIAVTFNCVGALSRRPKQLTGYYDATSTDGTTIVSIPPTFFKNDGIEPLEVHEMIVNVGGASNGEPTGEIMLSNFQMSLVGNGTNAEWFRGFDTSDDMMPGVLMGPQMGRAIVHRLPMGSDGHPGWLWYPGMGVSMEVADLAGGDNQAVYVGLLGHLIVK